MISEAGQRAFGHHRGNVRQGSAARRNCRRAVAPALELLEGRRLLSTFTGPSANRPVSSNGGLFEIQVSGPGVVKVFPAGRGAINLTAYGTTLDTTLSITQVRPRWHFPSQLLSIHNLRVTSGQLGSLNASAAELTGTMTPLNGNVGATAPDSDAVASLQLGELGPGARVNINGSVGVMSVPVIDLGPTGHFVVTGALNTAGLTGSMTVGAMQLDGGQFVIGQDSLAPISILGSLTISHDGLFSIGRDLDGSLSVNGNLVLDTGGQIMVGRNLSSLTVTGNLIVNPTGSGIVVNGALGSLTVDGFLQGQGGTAAPTVFDIGVGLNTGSLTILGANSGLNGLINANIRSGGAISGVDVVYGTVASTIQPNTPPPPPA
jgi:hypothetical protein